ncbi:MAG TPA: outer membrane protein transport protein [Pseudomonadales bacterium]|nr:outer membrane protein transport protein [Pseudomonadales bacterium]
MHIRFSTSFKKSALYLALGCSLTLPHLSAQAAIVDNVVVADPKALGMANAVTADPPGIFSIHFNPAGLAKVKHDSYTINAVVPQFNFRSEFYDHDPRYQQFLADQGWSDPVENTTSQTSKASIVLPGGSEVRNFPLPFLIVPTLGAAWHNENSPMTYGTAVYSPYGAGYMRDSDDPGKYDGQSLAVIRLTYGSPTVALQLNDHWYVGAGIGLSWMGIGLDATFRVPNIGLALVQKVQEQSCPSPQNPHPNTVLSNQQYLDICGSILGPYTEIARASLAVTDALSPSVNLGVLWEPTDWFAWGASYVSSAPIKATGKFTFDYGKEYQDFFKGFGSSAIGNFVRGPLTALGFPIPTGVAQQKGDAKINLTSPAQFSTGIKVVVLPDWQVNYDIKWMDWAKWKDLKLEFDQDMEFLEVVRLLQPKYAPDIRTFIIPRGYKSVWTWAVGVEHRYNDQLTLRAGYEPRKSSVPASKQDLLLPLPDTKLYTVGAEYKVRNELPFLPMTRNSTIAVAFGYMTGSQYVPAGSSSNANSMEGDNFVYNPYAGLNFKNILKVYIAEASFKKDF